MAEKYNPLQHLITYIKKDKEEKKDDCKLYEERVRQMDERLSMYRPQQIVPDPCGSFEMNLYIRFANESPPTITYVNGRWIKLTPRSYKRPY